MPESNVQATLILQKVAAGDPRAADELFPLIYEELRAIAATQLARERANHTLQPTALVHEAYLKLIDQSRVQWQDCQHFLAIGATIIRRILIDSARAKKAEKRGGKLQAMNLDCVEVAEPISPVDFEELDKALHDLAMLHERQARVVELRYFGGVELKMIGEMLGVSERTVNGDLRFARAWLENKLNVNADRH